MSEDLANVVCELPMSIGQRALWFEQLAQPNSNAYNLVTCMRFPHAVDRAALRSALQALSRRHPLLRARFAFSDQEPRCTISQAPLACHELASSPTDPEAAIAGCEHFLLRPYDLAVEDPFRLGIIDVAGGGALLAIGAHHIVVDLHSTILILHELAARYESSAIEAPGAVESESYAQFCRWQHTMIESNEGRVSAGFWQSQLKTLPCAPGFLEFSNRSLAAAECASRIEFSLTREDRDAIERAAAAASTTPFVVALTAMQVLLAARSKDGAALVGTPTAGRNNRRFRSTVGYFVNLLPMRLQVNPEETFATTVSANGERVRDALRHGQYPFASMVEQLRVAQGVTPLLQATLTFQKSALGLESPLARIALQLPGGGLTLGSQFGSLVPLRATMAQFPLGVAIAAADDGYIGCLDFDPSRVTESMAEQFCCEWLALLNAAARYPGRSIATLLAGAMASRGGQTDLASALEHALGAYADRPAVANAGEEWTYRQLAERSSAVVEQLRAAAVRRGQRVAVIGDGDLVTVCAMVGVLRAGAAFVPIDADVDLDRMRVLLEAAQVAAVFDCTPAMQRGGGLTSFTVLTPGIAQAATAQTPCASDPLDPAWVMFTSGTTGAPKAAIIPHEAALAHARGIVARFGLTSRDRVLQFASLSFDEHAEEIFPTLLAGGCVVCAPRVRMNDPETLLRLVQQSAISVLHLPTSYWHLWMDEAAHATMPAVPSLRLVNTGGEQASLARLRTWSQVMPPSVRWVNTYGLTEAAVTSLAWEFDREAGLQQLSRVPAGTPLAGSHVRIVSDATQDVPAGELGELLLGGLGVGLGYLQPSTASSNFFSVGGVRWLRTGDLASFDGAGNVVLAGRRDRVLKIRGARIDPAELEATIAMHPGVLECVVLLLEDEVSRDGGALELHVAVREGHSIAEADLRDHWQSVLPAVAAPSAIVFHRTIPRTAGLKPDFARMRRPGAAAHVHPEPGDDELVQRVTAIFVRLLQRPVGVDANFFALGGHSLLAMRLVAALRRELGVELSIADFLARPTLQAVVAHCRRHATVPVADQSPQNESSSYPLSRVQRRALLLAEAAGQSAARAIAVVRIEGEVDRARLRSAWRNIVRRHRLLTAAIDEAGNAENDVDCALHELATPASMPRNPAALARAARELFLRETDPMASLAGSLLETSDGVVLVVGARHLAADGGSLSILVREIAHDCGPSRAQLPPAASYRRFVAAESEWLASSSHAAARAYWEECLDGDPTPTRLVGMALDHPSDFRSRRIGIALGSRVQDQVFSFAREQHCTPFAVLLASFLALLARYSASDDVLIGVPVSLRELFGLPDVVGPTLNPLPFRIRVRLGRDFVALVRDVHARLAAAFQHGALPVEEMVARAPSLRGAPLPIQFVAQQTTVCAEEHAPTLRILSERDGQSPVALLAGVHLAPSIRLELEYRTAMIDDALALRLLDAWRLLLRALVAEPARASGAARMVSRGYLKRAAAVVAPLQPAVVGRCLHDGLREHAALHPERVALIGEGRRLTYRSLDVITDRHAARLAAAGVGKGDRVVIASRKGLADCVAALAILKAGAVYVPIAWDLPPVRVRSMAARVGARVATGAPGLDCIANETGATFIDVDLEESAQGPTHRLQVDPNDSAYILFTSGSTGEPKGVEVAHAAAMVTVNEILRRFAIGDHDVLYAHAALGFDLSVFDLFGAWTAGACVVLPGGDTRFDAFGWARDVAQHGVSVWNSVPSALDMLLDAAPSGSLRSLRRLLVSGDRIGLDLPGRARCACPDAMFVALGGATEAGIWSNCHIVDRVEPDWRSIPYGRPLAGQSMFVVEPTGWPAPPGVPGEICIGGGALARGYFGDAAQTAARFIWHEQSHQRIYRTGDQGRYFEDGSIEFLGRVDRQIKLRGHRIEAGDVEVAIAAVPGVRRALVNVIGNDTLVAFIVPEDATALDQSALHRHAEACLPEYMRPTRYEVIERVPLTANGKIDWNALADRGRASEPSASDGAVPLSVTERRIAAIWEAVLPGRAPRRNDDFFTVGGHSLLAVRLIARVQREFDCKIALSRWLREPTLAHLGRLVDSRDPLEQVKSNNSLRAQVRLAEDIVFAPPRAKPGATLITGASGLIGTRLLAAYLQNDGREIFCLVRDEPEHRAERAIARHLAQRGVDASSWRSRVRWVHGDLALPRFGLSEQAFAEIAAAVATVFHVGATVNLIAPYEHLARVNVGGTHEAIRLAALAGATLQHVSSIGVLPYGKGKLITESDSIDVPGGLLTGYCQTKWVAEQAVRRAAALGLRTAIYRPGLTLAEQPTGDDLLHVLASLMMYVGALPDLDVPIDLVGADYVASAMLQISTDARCIGGTFHLTHPHPVMLPAAMQRLRLMGIGLPVLSFTQWRAKLEAVLPDIRDPRSAAIAALIASQDEAELTPARIDCSRCCTLLQGTAVECASVLSLLAPRLRQLAQTAETAQESAG